MKSFFTGLVLFAVLLLTGCMVYHTPAGRAEFDTFIPKNDTRMQESFAAVPGAGLPANLVFVRVQAPGYSNHRTKLEGGVFGAGRYSIYATRELDEERELERFAGLPNIGEIGTLNRLLVPERLDSERDLRDAAARLKADMVVIYTFDTSFFANEKSGPLKTITLGNARTLSVTVNVTGSALVIDTRTGFIYAVLESSERRDLMTNLWRDRNDADAARREAEKAAFRKLADEFARHWDRITARVNQGA